MKPAWNELSVDGRTIYFAAGARCMRVSDVGNPVRARSRSPHPSAVKARRAPRAGKDEARPSYAQFRGASTDGSRVFFLDTQQLTDGATEGTGSAPPKGCAKSGSDCNLYTFVGVRGTSPGHDLIDVSAGDTSGRGPRVQGVLATSADGSHVYFVANGVLTGVPNGRGEKAIPGHCKSGAVRAACICMSATNVIRRGMSRSSRRSPADKARCSQNTDANVTPEGRFLVFESAGDLTAAHCWW